MKLIFRSSDFASVEGRGLGFANRRPLASPWEYQGRVRHPHWEGTFECRWETSSGASSQPSTLLWTVRGDARMFALAAALKSVGFNVDVEQN